MRGTPSAPPRAQGGRRFRPGRVRPTPRALHLHVQQEDRSVRLGARQRHLLGCGLAQAPHNPRREELAEARVHALAAHQRRRTGATSSHARDLRYIRRSGRQYRVSIILVQFFCHLYNEHRYLTLLFVTLLEIHLGPSGNGFYKEML